MNAEHWNRMKEVFSAALERAPSEREAYVLAVCGDDQALSDKVRSLLRAHEVEDDFIEQPASEQLGWFEEHPAQHWIGRRIGSYRIVAEAGRGGMSQVFRAVREHEEYDQQVAIKLLRPGLGANSILKRFRAERQILARLSHPNIAHFLDGGATQEGAPYLVMEYVEGQPIDEYCESRRLSLEQRLELFRTLCAAVHHVHQHLLVHGDLKGGNVLVTKEGVVKLLDFGIAKLLDAAGEHTRPATVLLLTPEYASPEQVRGEPITTASDVYSLGALLYRLIAGAPPFTGRRSSPLALAEQIDARDADPPSTAALRAGGEYARFARTLRGDLDNIVLKALKKSPAERYGSAEQLGDDLQRYLHGFPIEARADSAWYRVRKFTGRHRGASIAIGLFATALIGGIAATSWQAHIAREERARAERHFNDVRELSAVFLADVYEALDKIPGSTGARKLLIDNSLKYLTALEREAKDSRELQRDLGKAYELLGDVQGASLGASTGDYAAALENYRRSLEIRRALVQSDPGLDASHDLLRSHVVLTQALLQSGNTAEAADVSAAGVRVAEQVLGAPGVGRAERRSAGAMYLNHGAVQWTAGDVRGALATLERGRVVYRSLADEQPNDLTARRDLGVAAGRIGETWMRGAHDFERAVAAYDEALSILDSLLAQKPDEAELRRSAAFTRANLGELHNALHRPKRALEHLAPALQTLEELRVLDEADQFTPLAVAAVLNFMGDSRFQLGDYPASRRAFERAEALLQTVPVLNVSDARIHLGLAAAGMAKTRAALAHNSADRAAAKVDASRALALLTSLAEDPFVGAQARELIAEMEKIRKQTGDGVS